MKKDRVAKDSHFRFLFSPSSGYTDHPLTSMRAVIAKRLCQSKSTSPHGYATMECNIDALNRIRADFAKAGTAPEALLTRPLCI
jgi:pyruvate/2-oxoglutarate dehydrogenase complex dihydrolipoamide acyltransferase (E2) component